MVCFDTPHSRATSSTFRPASTCFSAAIICASVCLLFDMLRPHPEYENRTRLCADLGEQVKSIGHDMPTEDDAIRTRALSAEPWNSFTQWYSCRQQCFAASRR